MKVKQEPLQPRETTTAIAWLKFVPIFCLASLIIVFQMPLMVAAAVSCVVAGIIVKYVKRCSVNDVIDIMVDGAGKITVVYLILMLAYCVAESFMATGVGASIINLALKFGVSGRTIAPVGLLVTCVLSVATGSSWGAFAACAPVFLWLNYIVGGDIVLTACAIAGGSCFGDNIGLISDTTVVSSGLNNVEVIDRVRHQGIWSLLCMGVSTVIFFILSLDNPTSVGDPAAAINAIPPEAWAALEAERPSAILLLNQVRDGVPMYMIIPLLAVVGIAISGVSTMICLSAGMVVALIFGMFANTVTLQTFFFEIIPNGFAQAGANSVCLIMWIAAFGGLVSSMDAFAPLGALIVKHSTKVRHLLTWNGILCLFANAAFADEMAEITTTTPITKSIIENNVNATEEQMYKLRLRNATFSDALGVYGSQLIPWHCYIVFYVALSNAIFPMHQFTPFEFIGSNVMAFVAVSSILILTFTGWDRFIPWFKIPSEPEVSLKK